MTKKKLNKIRYVKHRLEIAFWQATVPVSDKRRRAASPLQAVFLARVGSAGRAGIRTLAGLLARTGLPGSDRLMAPDRLRMRVLSAAGAILLLLAVWSGLRAFRSGSFRQPAEQAYQKILLVFLDNLSGRTPLLKGVWLMTMPNEQPFWDIAPVYPASLSGGEEEDAKLLRSFRLGLNGAPGTEFHSLLHGRGIQWDSVIVLDEIALAGYIDLLGGVEIGMGRLDGDRTVAQMLALQTSSQKALMAQAVLIRSLCHQSIALFRDVDPLAARERFSGHVYTDHPARIWAEQWYDMRDYGSGLVCEFPTLQSQLTNIRP